MLPLEKVTSISPSKTPDVAKVSWKTVAVTVGSNYSHSSVLRTTPTCRIRIRTVAPDKAIGAHSRCCSDQESDQKLLCCCLKFTVTW